ncbi:hypothetical protein SAMN02910456_01319 [Ruminococcaceae bacterium YRB3002]|nr:hypothetical protein SAMN02910456_01319 [Ruminococcaceae bacterium YRB3002]
MKLSDKRYITVLVLILCLCGLTACREKSTGETEDEEDDETVITEVEEDAKVDRDYQAVDDFLMSNFERLENSVYTQIESEEFPGCGPDIMFLVVNSVNRDAEFVRSSDDTIAFVPQTIDEDDLCWVPEDCDAIFYVYSETPKKHMTYDNGTNGYSTATMVTVIFPKDGTYWGPVEAHLENAPRAVSGQGVGVDTYAPFEYMEGIFYASSECGISADTIISINAANRYFKIGQDLLGDGSAWRDLAGMTLEDKQGDTLKLYIDEQSHVRGIFTSADEDVNDMDVLILFGNGSAAPGDEINMGRIYETTGHNI